MPWKVAVAPAGCDLWVIRWLKFFRNHQEGDTNLPLHLPPPPAPLRTVINLINHVISKSVFEIPYTIGSRQPYNRCSSVFSTWAQPPELIKYNVYSIKWQSERGRFKLRSLMDPFDDERACSKLKYPIREPRLGRASINCKTHTLHLIFSLSSLALRVSTNTIIHSTIAKNTKVNDINRYQSKALG